MATINWNMSKHKFELILKIAVRARELTKDTEIHARKDTLEMDVAACHLNGCPLRLQELLDADNGNFAHDVFGIQKYIDRKTGKLMDCFDPRYSVPENAVEEVSNEKV